METKMQEGFSYCRKCATILPSKNFYDCVDEGFIDSNFKFSVCKECINTIYDELALKYNSMEKAIHKMCTSLNVMFSNDALSATKAHIDTLLQSGKAVNAVFGIYKQKLLSTQKSMSKSSMVDMTYEDVGTIYTSEAVNTKEIPIPQEVAEFWGKNLNREDIEFLELNYANFKQTHAADTYAEIVLLKQVCYTLLDIQRERNADTDGEHDTEKLVKELQNLMKNLAISPNAINAASGGKGADTFGLWIQDIEREEPAQWLKEDPRGDMYRDVGNVEEYFEKYIRRPLKNFITSSKDFNVDDDSLDNDSDMDGDFKLIDDGELEA
jgi:uncharacterized protein YdaT